MIALIAGGRDYVPTNDARIWLKKKLEQLAPKKKQVNQDNQEQIKIDNRYKI